ncbi:MAG: type II toxin-antitoxin system VapC family toxin [Gammaproteobacteria bacterium]|nr:type II toxin-antitoxin system VapC family toxin [Gammaproteobacteria bacterium]
MIEPQVVVPDASVILKWVLPPADESDVEQAIRLRDAIANGQARAVVPSLWIYELGNTLARRVPKSAEAILGALKRFDFNIGAESQNWMSQVLDLTRRYGVTFYDAAYHALAIIHQGVFVTADERYLRQAAEAGRVAHVRKWRERTPTSLSSSSS